MKSLKKLSPVAFLFALVLLVSPLLPGGAMAANGNRSNLGLIQENLNKIDGLLVDLTSQINRLGHFNKNDSTVFHGIKTRVDNLSYRLDKMGPMKWAKKVNDDNADNTDWQDRWNWNWNHSTSTATTSQGNTVGNSNGNVSGGGFVSINFDDGDKTAFDIARPIVESAGFPATYYITTHQLGNLNFSGYISSSDIKQLINEGNEVGNHTQTHPHFIDISPTQIQSEIEGAQQDLANIGADVKTFAYPFGETGSGTVSILKAMGFIGARGTGDGLNFKDTDPFRLKSDSLTQDTTFEEVKANIDSALNEHGWYIMNLHAINKPGEYYSVSPELVQQIVDYLKSRNVPVVTNEQGLRQFIGAEVTAPESTTTPSENETRYSEIDFERKGENLWRSEKIEVTGNTRYIFSDNYRSSEGSEIDITYHFGKGKTQTVRVEQFPQGDWQKAEINFATPSGAKAMVIKHLVNGNGNIEAKDFKLTMP